jgi:hypothetical protein
MLPDDGLILLPLLIKVNKANFLLDIHFEKAVRMAAKSKARTTH